MSDTIELIQPDVVAKLNSEAVFANVAIFKIRDQRIESEIDSALAGLTQKNGKCGAAIEVMMPKILRPNGNVPGILSVVELEFLAKENPTINLVEGTGTGMTAEQIGEAILSTLNGFRFEGVLESLYPAPEAMVPNRDFLPFVAYTVKLWGVRMLPQLPQTASVAAVCPAQTFTLTCADAGAAIYYSLDRSYPWPGNEEVGINEGAVLYTGPVTVPTGTTVRTAALADGKQWSFVGQFKVT